MPIPPFDGNMALPPHLGDPRRPQDLSPYPTDCPEFCTRFGSSPERRAILRGWLEFRQLLARAGFVVGFQWIGGSFIENVEQAENRSPHDLDVVTFYIPPDHAFNERTAADYPILTNRPRIRQDFQLDHFIVDMQRHPTLTVESSRYWVTLFSHRRDKVWKGMLKVPLGAAGGDDQALDLLKENHE